jgi:jumonji domain-containing protein 7
LEPSTEKIKWVSVNPDLAPNQALKHKYHVVLQKGDVLYLPAFWYHQVSQHHNDYINAVNFWWDMDYGSNVYCIQEVLRSLVQNNF